MFKTTKMKPFGVLIEAIHSDQDIQDLNIEELRAIFKNEQLIALRGFRTFHDADGFADYCARFGEISVWPFGKVLELVEHENPTDHIFDHNYVPLHWDGMYRPQVPEYQIFHCVRAPLPGKGGRTTFSNTILALEHASEDLKALWNKVTGVYKRKMEFYHSKIISPIVTTHPGRGYSVIRYNEPPSTGKDFLNPPDLEFTGLTSDEQESFHRGLKEALYAKTNFYAHEWRTGDVVIADNLSLLHGREGFVSKSPRHIRRVHVLGEVPFENSLLESYT